MNVHTHCMSVYSNFEGLSILNLNEEFTSSLENMEFKPVQKDITSCNLMLVLYPLPPHRMSSYGKAAQVLSTTADSWLGYDIL